MKKALALFFAITLLLSMIIPASANGYIDKNGIKVSTSSSFGEEREDYSPYNMIDGNAETYWHSFYSVVGGNIVNDKPPFRIYMEFPTEQLISGFTYTPRTDNTNGTARKYNFYASSDGVTAYLIDSGDGIEDRTVFTKNFGKTYKVKGIVLELTETVGNFGSCAELDFIKGTGSATAIPNKSASVKMNVGGTASGNTASTNKPQESTEVSVSETPNGSYLDKSYFNVRTSSSFGEDREDYAPKNIIDGDENTYWHSIYSVVDGKIVNEKPPFYIYIEFPTEQIISGFTYTARKDNNNGTVQAYNFYATEDGETAYLIDSGRGIEDITTFTKNFGKSYKVKGIVFELTEAIGNFGSCAEFDLIAGKGTVTPVPVGASVKMSGESKPTTGNATATPSASETPNGAYLDKSTFTVRASSAFEGREDYAATNIADGDAKTYWHSLYSVVEGKIVNEKPPFYIYIEFPTEQLISGFTYTPRTDNTNGTARTYNFYATEDGETAYLIDSGDGIEDKKAFTKNFGKSYKAKGIVFEMTSTVGNFGSCAEFDIIKGSGSATPIPKGSYVSMKGGSATLDPKDDPDYIKNSLPRDKWNITVNSIASGYELTNLTDGNKETYWHSFYKAAGGAIVERDTPPFTITIELPEAEYISGLTYTPRQDQATGRFTAYNIYLSDSVDGEKYLVNSGNFDNSIANQKADFGVNIKAKVVTLEATSSQESYGTCAEVYLSGKDDKYETYENAKDYEDVVAETRPYKVNTNGFIISDNSHWADIYKASLMFDGDNGTIWHSHPDDKGIVFSVKVDMGKVHSLKGFDYVARNNDESGFLFKFSVFGSVDGENYTNLYGNVIEISQDDMKRGQVYHFDFPEITDAQYLEIEIEKGFLGHAAVGEFVLYETRASYEKAEKKNLEKYVLTIGKNQIATDINGENDTINLDVAPFIDNGRTMIPLRGLLEAMGASIEWQGETRTIVVTKGKSVLTLQIVNNLVYVYKYLGGEYKTVRYTMDVPPKIKDSRTFIPVRFVTEHLGYNVSWNGETQEITITNN